MQLDRKIIAEARLELPPDLAAEVDARVKERTAELQHANEELEWFAYALSHDLRSSLTTAGMSIDLLRRSGGPALDPMSHTLLGSLDHAVQKMRKMVDSTLKLAGLAGGRAEVRRVNLSALALRIVSELRQTDPQRTVAVTIAPGIEVLGEELLLHIALENLLGNAWKFTSRVRSPQIEFGGMRRGDQIIFFVADNGAGFDMKSAGKLFAPFHRLHTSAEFPGTGIGLATVKRIVDRHQGRVWAEALPGHGATFFVALPDRS